MRASPQLLTNGQTVIFPVDYFTPNLTIQAVVSGTATYSVTQTLDDPNTVAVLTWFPVVAALTAATTNQISAISQSPVRALRFQVTAGSGSVTFTVLQGSGDGFASA
jgi:hypothetical protein